MSRLSGASLFATATSGLTNTYSVLAQQFTDGLTLENLSSSDATTLLSNNSISQSFKSYLQTNFSSVDKDSDGVISATEIQNATNTMTQSGMTRAQISQLGTANGYSSETIEKILNHFDDIDTNHDGKVTEAEISAYGVESEKQNKLTEYMNQKATNMSLFYGSEDSSSSNSSSSILSYKYLKDDE